MRPSPVRLFRLLILLLPSACEVPPVRYEEAYSWATTDGDKETLACARVAASTLTVEDREGIRTKLSVRLYVENLVNGEA